MGSPLVVTVNEMSNKGDECSFCHRGEIILDVNIKVSTNFCTNFPCKSDTLSMLQGLHTKLNTVTEFPRHCSSTCDNI